MAAQEQIMDDAVSLDGDDIQLSSESPQTKPSARVSAHIVPANVRRPAATPSHTPSNPRRTETPSITTHSSTPVLDTLTNSLIAREHENPAHPLTFLEPQEKHPSTTSFESLIDTTHLELFDFWFCQGSAYDHVCLARADWHSLQSAYGLGTFLTRAEFHLQLYAYTIKRSAAVGVLLSRGYEVCGTGTAANDAAFRVVVEALVFGYEDLLPSIVDWAERGRRRTLMIDHPRLLKAIQVVRGLPLRFRVGIAGGGGEGAKGKGTKVEAEEEMAFVRFVERKGEDGRVTWDVEMEVVAVEDADKICDGKEYAL